MIQKISKQKVFDLYKSIQSVKNLPGVKFSYAIARNEAKIKSEIEALQKAGRPSEKFIEYNNKRLDLSKKHAVIVDGKPSAKVNDLGQEYYVIADEAAFNKEFETLKTEYKDVIDEEKSKSKEIDNLLTEEIEIDFYMINIKNVPENITPEQMAGLLPIIEEDKN